MFDRMLSIVITYLLIMFFLIILFASYSVVTGGSSGLSMFGSLFALFGMEVDKAQKLPVGQDCETNKDCIQPGICLESSDGKKCRDCEIDDHCFDTQTCSKKGEFQWMCINKLSNGKICGEPGEDGDNSLCTSNACGLTNIYHPELSDTKVCCNNVDENNMCLAILNGDECTYNSQCQSGRCVGEESESGLCQAKLNNGQPCNGKVDCISHKCINGFCRECEFNTDCPSDKPICNEIHSGVEVWECSSKKDNWEPCGEASGSIGVDYFPETCATSICGIAKENAHDSENERRCCPKEENSYCIDIPNGVGCSFDWQCQSNRCVDRGDADAYCGDKLDRDAECDENPDCKSDRCLKGEHGAYRCRECEVHTDCPDGKFCAEKIEVNGEMQVGWKCEDLKPDWWGCGDWSEDPTETAKLCANQCGIANEHDDDSWKERRCCPNKEQKDGYDWCKDIPNDKACTFDWQCQSGRCMNRESDEGVCKPKAGVGAECDVSADCKDPGRCLKGEHGAYRCRECEVHSDCPDGKFCAEKSENYDKDGQMEVTWRCEDLKPDWWGCGEWSEDPEETAKLCSNQCGIANDYDDNSYKVRRCCPNKEQKDGYDWCKDIPNDKPCTFDWQCQSGRCMNRESEEAVCKPKVGVGAECDENADCKDPGRCLEGEHGADRCRECQVHSDCPDGKFCAEKSENHDKDGKMEVTWRCEDLKPDWWGCGEWSEDPEETGKLCANQCGIANDYDDNSYKVRRCCPNKVNRDGYDWCKDIPNDKPCTFDWQCESGRCMNRESEEAVCKPKLGIGAKCDEHQDCQRPANSPTSVVDGRCLTGEGGDDRCRECEVTSDCADNEFCAEHIDGKIAWKCQPLKGDWYGCGEASGYPGEDYNPEYCAADLTCAIGNQDAHDYWKERRCCRKSREYDGEDWCINVINDKPCTYHWQCAESNFDIIKNSSFCNDDNNVCQTKFGKDALCDENAQCESGRCLKGEGGAYRCRECEVDSDCGDKQFCAEKIEVNGEMQIGWQCEDLKPDWWGCGEWSEDPEETAKLCSNQCGIANEDDANPYRERRCCPNKVNRDGYDWCKDIPNDKPCTFDWQCQSGRCMNRESEEAVCKPKVGVGSECDEHQDCQRPANSPTSVVDGRCLTGQGGDDRCRECEVTSDCADNQFCAEHIDDKIAWKCQQLKGEYYGCGEAGGDEPGYCAGNLDCVIGNEADPEGWWMERRCCKKSREYDGEDWCINVINDKPCTYHWQCAESNNDITKNSSFCNDNDVCQTKFGKDALCDENAQCESGRCLKGEGGAYRCRECEVDSDCGDKQFCAEKIEVNGKMQIGWKCEQLKGQYYGCGEAWDDYNPEYCAGNLHCVIGNENDPKGWWMERRCCEEVSNLHDGEYWCKDVENDKPCTYNWQCQNNSFCNESGLCQTKIAVGGLCKAGTDCEKGRCLKGEGGDYRCRECQFDTDCGDNKLCAEHIEVNGKMQIGWECEPLKGEYYGCKTQNDCARNLHCVIGNEDDPKGWWMKNRCCKKRHLHDGEYWCKDVDNGKPCTYNWQCQNGSFCNESGLCQSKIRVGDLCNTGSDCTSGRCLKGSGGDYRCRECQTNSDCPGAQFCREKGDDGRISWDCYSKKPNGWGCSVNSQCASGICHASKCRQCSPSHGCPGGQFCREKNDHDQVVWDCYSKKPNGWGCSVGSQCASGCCGEGGKCAERGKKREDEYCDHNCECKYGDCSFWAGAMADVCWE